MNIMIIHVSINYDGFTEKLGERNNQYSKSENWKPVTGMGKLSQRLTDVAATFESYGKLLRYLNQFPNEAIPKSVGTFLDPNTVKVKITSTKDKTHFEIPGNPSMTIITAIEKVN
jgi:hypothetical protein